MFYIVESNLGGDLAAGEWVGAEWYMLSGQGQDSLLFQCLLMQGLASTICGQRQMYCIVV